MQRRRFIKIVATHAAGLSLCQLANGLTNVKRLHPVRWQGYTLGAVGNFTLFTDAPKTAQEVLQICFKEIRRLESLFSLYDSES
jgi:FAD:protein FMN transferase